MSKPTCYDCGSSNTKVEVFPMGKHAFLDIDCLDCGFGFDGEINWSKKNRARLIDYVVKKPDVKKTEGKRKP